MLEMGWRTASPTLVTWVDDYVVRRYGVTPAAPALLQAWQLLSTTVYSATYTYETTTSLCGLEDAPGLTPTGGSSAIAPDAIVAAARLMLAVASADARYDPAANPQFRYDLIDLLRQLACDVFYDVAVLRGAEYLRFMNHNEATAAMFNSTSSALAGLLAALEAMLLTDVNFLGLGPWLADAGAWAPPGNATIAAWLSFNALNQVTLWGECARTCAGVVYDRCRCVERVCTAPVLTPSPALVSRPSRRSNGGDQ